MFNNLSIHRISLYITLSLVIFNTFLVYFLFAKYGQLEDFPVVFVVFFLSAITLYLVIKLLLEKYIFRKIKIIYKIIHDSKVDRGAKKSLKLSNTTLEKVNDEVVKWAENTEKEIQSLKLLEQYRKDFVGNISHELKTPIFSIQGYLHTLLDGALYDDKINMKYLNRAVINVDRLQSIVEDLEEISKLESGKLILDIRKFDIKALAQEVIQDLEVLAKERNIKLTFKEGADLPFNVLADRETIRQVLNNLITNSIKYGKDGGRTRLSFYDIDKNVLIEVSDNGLGIDDVHLRHLFDRFYRVDTSRSRLQGGSGLGLSIVKHIIEAHNQTINVRSTPGVGSTFGFTLKKASGIM